MSDLDELRAEIAQLARIVEQLARWRGIHVEVTGLKVIIGGGQRTDGRGDLRPVKEEA